jgi:histidinol-phosphate phosphatase family protein
MEVSQAVIFAGGRGSRLGTLTDSLPKPMMDICGRPFLDHLIRNLVRQGISEVVILTGYLKEAIRDYFETYPIPKVEIKFSEGPVEWDTGERLVQAESLLKKNFFLLYSDNYTVVDLSSLLKSFKQSPSSLQLLLAEKSRGNISINEAGFVLKYDRGRKDDNCPYVEIGFMLCNRDSILKILREGENQSFSSVIEKLVESHEVRAVISEHPYLSVSDPERLEITRKYFSAKKILILDRDGTINKKLESKRYLTELSEFEFVQGFEESIRKLSEHNYSFIVITNQAGIATGDIDPNNLKEIHNYLAKQFLAWGAELLEIFTCPDHWSDSLSGRRKPAPGMFVEASKAYSFLLDRTIYVGDDPRDMKAAERAGCRGIYLSESQKGLADLELSDYFRAQQLHISKDWLDACQAILMLDGK